jgi:hypothetical protein
VHSGGRIPGRYSRREDVVLNCQNLWGYDYVSVSKEGFIPVSVKPVIGVTRLAHDIA